MFGKRFTLHCSSCCWISNVSTGVPLIAESIIDSYVMMIPCSEANSWDNICDSIRIAATSFVLINSCLILNHWSSVCFMAPDTTAALAESVQKTDSFLNTFIWKNKSTSRLKNKLTKFGVNKPSKVASISIQAVVHSL